MVVPFCFGTGSDHCAWLSDDGSVWTSGSNKYGQLGYEDKGHTNIPFRISNLPPISPVQFGCCSTLCLDIEGNLWSFGSNMFGQLGLGDTNNCFSPHLISGIPPVHSFAFHCKHVICLCQDGSIWAFGANECSQLGLGHQNRQSIPSQLPTSYFPHEIISVSTGYYHSLFITSEGQVLSCGGNGMGQLGLGDSTNRSTPTLISNMNECIQIACGGEISCMVDTSQRLWVCGSHRSVPLTVPLCFTKISFIQSISVGHMHTLCINENGELWGWGNGEISNGAVEPCDYPILLKENILSAMCLGHASFIRDASDRVFCRGRNRRGQLGLGNTNEHPTFTNFSEEKFAVIFPASTKKFSQKSARSAYHAE